MPNPYPHLLEPLKVGSFTLKNRIESPNSMPHFLQGKENYPAASMVAHFANRAKNGAAIVTVSGINNFVEKPHFPDSSDMAHFPEYDIFDPLAQNYLIQASDTIRFWDSVPAAGLFSPMKLFPLQRADGSIETVRGDNGGSGMAAFGDCVTDGLSRENMEKIVESHAQQAALLKRLGFDMVSLHFAYRAQLAGQFLAAETNHRTDEFGGSLENRARFPLMLLKAIRDAVGKNFLIGVQVSGDDPDGGNTTGDVIEFLRMAEPLIDIAQIRGGDGDASGLSSFEPERYPTLAAAEKIKSAGLDIRVSPVGGFSNPADAENLIAEGRVDMVTMARAWICEPNYGGKLYAGRGEDIAPCLRCNRCHGRGTQEPMTTVCSVNPMHGLEHYSSFLETRPAQPRNIAVIGGGPAGCRTAIFLADRGHTVTLFEQESQLGGLIRHADNVDFKWTLRDYKNWLVRQVERGNIDVRLNTHAVPADVMSRYQVVIAAVGADPVRPPIIGADGDNVVFAIDVLMGRKPVGRRVVVIGGGEVGCETGMYLAKRGCDVAVLELRDQLAADATMVHYRGEMQQAWEAIPTFTGITGAAANWITKDGVYYTDQKGATRMLPADTVVLSAGMTARREEALSFSRTADRFFLVGDCKKPGNLQTANRAAYGLAQQL